MVQNYIIVIFYQSVEIYVRLQRQCYWIAKVVGSGALVYPTSSIQDSINVEG